MSGFEFTPLSLQRHLVWDLLRDTDPYYLNHQIFHVDFSAVDELRQRWCDEGREKPSYVACTLYAMSRVVPLYPVFNSYLREFPIARLALFKGVDIAYTLEKREDDGRPVLTLSIIEDCSEVTFADFLGKLEKQKEASLDELGYTRASRRYFSCMPNLLRRFLFRVFCKPFPNVMRKVAGTVAFTSVGKHGVDVTTPLAPKSLTVSLGAVCPRPMVREDRVEARNSAYVTLTYDHRVADGSDCARLGTSLREFIETGLGEVDVTKGECE